MLRICNEGIAVVYFVASITYTTSHIHINISTDIYLFVCSLYMLENETSIYSLFTSKVRTSKVGNWTTYTFGDLRRPAYLPMQHIRHKQVSSINAHNKTPTPNPYCIYTNWSGKYLWEPRTIHSIQLHPTGSIHHPSYRLSEPISKHPSIAVSPFLPFPPPPSSHSENSPKNPNSQFPIPIPPCTVLRCEPLKNASSCKTGHPNPLPTATATAI